MDAQREKEQPVSCKAIGLTKPNGLSPDYIGGRRPPNLHSDPSSIVLENNFSKSNPSVFCVFHRYWIRACDLTFNQ